jgi:hypothetical protein
MFAFFPPLVQQQQKPNKLAFAVCLITTFLSLFKLLTWFRITEKKGLLY